MIIVNKNEGAKIPYEADGKRICFADDLTINLAKREQDWNVHIDICHDEDGELVIGAAAGRRYVAEIDIPKRSYTEVEDEDSGSDMQGMGGTKIKSVPVPLDMEKVALSLWSIE